MSRLSSSVEKKRFDLLKKLEAKKENEAAENDALNAAIKEVAEEPTNDDAKLDLIMEEIKKIKDEETRLSEKNKVRGGRSDRAMAGFLDHRDVSRSTRAVFPNKLETTLENSGNNRP